MLEENKDQQYWDDFERGLELPLEGRNFRKGDVVSYKGQIFFVEKDGHENPTYNDDILLRPKDGHKGDEFLTAPRSKVFPVSN